MKRKKIKWIIAILLIVSVLVLPMFVSNPGVRINPITHTVFKISAEDNFAIILDGGTESWYVELTGEEREKAIDIINETKFVKGSFCKELQLLHIKYSGSYK